MLEYKRIKIERNLRPIKSTSIIKSCIGIISKARSQINNCVSDSIYLIDFSQLYYNSMKEAYDYSDRFGQKESKIIYKGLYRSINRIFNEVVFNKLYSNFGQIGIDNAKYMLSIKHMILNNYMRYRIYTLAMIICSNYIHEIEEEDFEKLLINLAYGFKVNCHTIKPNTNTWENLLREWISDNFSSA